MTIILNNAVEASKRKKLRKLDDEIWKEIEGSNNMYFVSNYGRVKSFRINKEQGEVLSGSFTRGYSRVSMKINGEPCRLLVHKLVAEAFVEKPSDEDLFVIHLDWNKKNNKAENLQWVSKKEMITRMFSEYKRRIKSRGQKIITNSKLKPKDILILKKMIEKGVPQYKIAQMFCISATQVKRITRGENWSHVVAKPK